MKIYTSLASSVAHETLLRISVRVLIGRLDVLRESHDIIIGFIRATTAA